MKTRIASKRDSTEINQRKSKENDRSRRDNDEE